MIHTSIFIKIDKPTGPQSSTSTVHNTCISWSTSTASRPLLLEAPRFKFFFGLEAGSCYAPGGPPEDAPGTRLWHPKDLNVILFFRMCGFVRTSDKSLFLPHITSLSSILQLVGTHVSVAIGKYLFRYHCCFFFLFSKKGVSP